MALTNGQIAAHRDGADPEAGRRGVVQVPDALDRHVRVGEDAFQAVGDGVERLEENSAPITYTYNSVPIIYIYIYIYIYMGPLPASLTESAPTLLSGTGAPVSQRALGIYDITQCITVLI
jgi:hypothetical protein